VDLAHAMTATGGSPVYYGINCAHPAHVGGCCGTDARHIRAIAGTVLG
jgi:S-methylmethionine-dependent homocysteine/selenocysteine methylase